MKIIEGLKKIKDLKRKLGDIQIKIITYSADYDCDNPVYENQRLQIDSWLQAAEDLTKEVSNLTHRIHKTNISTNISIEVAIGKSVNKSIDEWLLRVNGLAEDDKNTWNRLNTTDINTEKKYRLPGSNTDILVKKRLYFDPKKRDEKVEEYTSEISKISSKLEIVNAITDLLD